MLASLPATVDFDGARLSITEHNGTPWLTAGELSRALGYSQKDAVTKIYRRHASEFSEQMTALITVAPKVGVTGVPTETRIFSARGCHLVAMFARTPMATRFRRWVLDVLESIGQQRDAGLAVPGPEYRQRLYGIANGFLCDLRAAYDTQGPLPDWPKELTDDGMRVAMLTDVLASSRWVVSFDHTGQLRMSPAASGAMMLTPDDILRRVASGDLPFTKPWLARLGAAIMKRLGA